MLSMRFKCGPENHPPIWVQTAYLWEDWDGLILGLLRLPDYYGILPRIVNYPWTFPHVFFWGYKSRRAKRVGKSGKWPSSQPLAQRHVGVRNIRRTGLMKRGAAFDAYIITYIYIYTRVYIDRDVHINVYIWFITSSLGSFRNVLGFQLVCLKSWDACQCTTWGAPKETKTEKERGCLKLRWAVAAIHICWLMIIGY